MQSRLQPPCKAGEAKSPAPPPMSGMMSTAYDSVPHRLNHGKGQRACKVNRCTSRVLETYVTPPHNRVSSGRVFLSSSGGDCELMRCGIVSTCVGDRVTKNCFDYGCGADYALSNSDLLVRDHTSSHPWLRFQFRVTTRTLLTLPLVRFTRFFALQGWSSWATDIPPPTILPGQFPPRTIPSLNLDNSPPRTAQNPTSKLHIYIHVCTHAYIYTYVHIHIDACTHVYTRTIHTCIHTYIYSCIHIHLYTVIYIDIFWHTYTYMYTYMHTKHTCIHTCICRCMYVCICMYVYVCMYMYACICMYMYVCMYMYACMLYRGWNCPGGIVLHPV